MFRRLFNLAAPNAEYLRIPEAFVVYFKLESIHSSWTSEIAHKTEASVWIKPNQTEIQNGYLSAESCRYIILLCLIVSISSTPVTTANVQPAWKYNYVIFNIIKFHSSEYIYGFRLSSRRKPILI